ncbi:MAG: ATP-binding protein [Pseudomonadota bacterium]|nr:ATP-binding protein [Pseudomonadota bacterium]
MLKRLPLRHRLAATAVLYAVAMLAAVWFVHDRGGTLLQSFTAAAVVIALMWLHLLRLHRKVQSMYRALAGTVDSYRDGDYSFSLAWPWRDELAELVAAHNRLGNTLREQRIGLVQRELLLDTIVQNTPVAMTLVDPAGRVVLGNVAARKLLGDGRRIEGRAFDTLLADAPDALRLAFERGGDAIFAVGSDDDEDIYHLSRRRFRLNGRAHELVLLRQLTAELRRQEVQTWKKVIRVISHELNNSLAPIASLAHSGSELLRRQQYEKLPLALATIEERARHLEGFIRDYARFAKLPAPRLQGVLWQPFLHQLQTQVAFDWDGNHADASFRADTAQLEQALLNVLKNAHEAGGDGDEIRLQLRRAPNGWRIDVLDRGSGMSEAVLAQALLPFYSTKRNGTGLGMALTREIIEAHGGHIALANRDGGGLCVSLSLPD